MSAQVSPLFPRQPSHAYLDKEADHRIANSLAMIGSLVRLQALKGDMSDPKALLIEIADRIDAVGKLHRLLAKSGSQTVMLDAYLKEICDILTASVGQSGTRVLFGCSTGHVVPADVALPLGLIVAELISNSLKYAHPTGLPVKISLDCNRNEAGGIALAYEDDGVGLPEGFDVSNDGHMGMRFIEALTRQVNATCEWASDPLGIRFEMAVPAPANEC
jgi:two-component sensor histidine kinase